MKTKQRYVCDDCEDYEEMDAADFVDGMHCECGGHLFLKRYNNFDEHTNRCRKCKNYASSSCATCIFPKG